MSFRTSFLKWSVDRFPELASELEGETANTRMYFAFLSLRKHTQTAIDQHDRERLIELFEMAERVLNFGYPEMRALFHVVYVEDLKFHDEQTQRSWAIDFLTSLLRRERSRSLPGLPNASS